MSVHTSLPAHLQSISPSHSAGIGSQVGEVGSWACLSTHMVPSGQVPQSGTKLQLSAGTHWPLQQPSTTPATWPLGHSGGSESHSTLVPSQSTFSVTHTPNRHTAWSMPSRSQV